MYETFMKKNNFEWRFDNIGFKQSDLPNKSDRKEGVNNVDPTLIFSPRWQF